MNHRYLSQSVRPPAGTVRDHAPGVLPRVVEGRTVLGLALFTLAAFGLTAGPVFGALRSFKLSQTAILEESPPSIRSYVRVLDERNEPLFHLDGMIVTATLGDRELELRDLRSFEESGEGVAYVFLVDISRSLSLNEFALIQASIENWITSLGERDRAAILAFGSESRLVVDFTNDLDQLRESINALGPTDDSTVFFEALQNGFELARRRDPDLPGRRALIVLTDGRDEGSGWSLEDVLAVLRDDPTPIYAVGLSRIRNPEERQRYLRLLGRLATNSGGAFFEGSPDNLIALYRNIREAIHNVWVVDFVCPDCNRNGESYRLQVNLTDGGRVFSDGQKIRLLPPAAIVSTAPDEPGEIDRTGTDAPVQVASRATEGEVDQQAESSDWGWLWLGLPLLATGAAGWLVWNRREPGPTTLETDLETPPELGPVKAETYTAPSGVVTTRPPRPIKLRLVRLIVIRGRQPGRTYNVTLVEKAVVGARSSCDCVLIDEPGTSLEQFELYQMDGHVFIRNLSEERPTLVDGLPTEPQHRIQSEALVGTPDFIVRVIFGEGRATARA